MEFLQVDRLGKYFREADGGTLCVFKDVSFQVTRGSFVTVVGHSGCGKSTLLNIIAGLDKQSEGVILLENKELTGPGLDRMVVFQSFSLMPWMTVSENIRLAVRAAFPSWDRDRVCDYVQKYVDLVGLKGAEHKRPSALSGGMKQRVGLARAFSIEPKVLLLDEPFAQIDALTRGVIQEELVKMWTATNNTVFMVTHDVDEAILLSDQVLLMSSGPESHIAEIVEISIPRPRERATVIEHPCYYKIRNHIIRFLIDCGKQRRDGAGSQSEQAVERARQPMVIRFDESAGY